MLAVPHAAQYGGYSRHSANAVYHHSVVLLRDVKIDRARRPVAASRCLNLTTFVVLATIRAVRIAAHIRRFWKV